MVESDGLATSTFRYLVSDEKTEGVKAVVSPNITEKIPLDTETALWLSVPQTGELPALSDVIENRMLYEPVNNEPELVFNTPW